jgi:hypothetical protein
MNDSDHTDNLRSRLIMELKEQDNLTRTEIQELDQSLMMLASDPDSLQRLSPILKLLASQILW